MNDCRHPLFMQYVQGAEVRCGYCDEVTADLMAVQAKAGAAAWLLVVALVFEREQGSAQPIAEFLEEKTAELLGWRRRKPRMA